MVGNVSVFDARVPFGVAHTSAAVPPIRGVKWRLSVRRLSAYSHIIPARDHISTPEFISS